jgi:hypothetical protein
VDERASIFPQGKERGRAQEKGLYSGFLQDFVLLLLKFLLGQHAGFSELSEQPELSKLIAVRVVLGLLVVLGLVLCLLASNQVA